MQERNNHALHVNCSATDPKFQWVTMTSLFDLSAWK